MFYYDGKIYNKYPREDIKETLDGLVGSYYKLIDNRPEYDELTQYIVKDKIQTTNELYEGLKHLKIAYQTYKVIDKTEDQLNNELDEKFGNWLDAEYPGWKRQKHALESDLSNGNKKNNADKWRNWEISQRELLEQKKINKDYVFNFQLPE